VSSWSSSALATLQLPLLIFVAELGVVTISTLRIIFVARGKKYLAPLLGTFEIVIWLYAVGQIMQNLSDITCYLAFAGGFTTGNYLGILIEQKLALGSVVVRIITNKDARPLIADLQAAEYGVTTMDGRGATGPVQIVFSIVKRKELAHVISIIQRFDRRAFYSVDDLQSASQGISPETKTPTALLPRGWQTAFRGLEETDPVAGDAVVLLPER
jgi:uncharacterized protein YebE (UPF0316 family)